MAYFQNNQIGNQPQFGEGGFTTRGALGQEATFGGRRALMFLASPGLEHPIDHGLRCISVGTLL